MRISDWSSDVCSSDLVEHPVAAIEHIAETRAAVRRLLSARDIDDEEASTLFLRFPEYSFLRARPDQVAWQALALRDSKPGDVVVAVRPLDAGDHALEVFVHSPDRDGLFAAIVSSLDRLGVQIQPVRALVTTEELRVGEECGGKF